MTGPRRPRRRRAALPADETSATGSRRGEPTASTSCSPATSATFTITVPRSSIATEIDGDPGVYWFGVHAIGSSAVAPRDEFADGRGPHLPALVPPQTAGRGPTPPWCSRCAGSWPRAPTARCPTSAAWQRSLGADGRLARSWSIRRRRRRRAAHLAGRPGACRRRAPARRRQPAALARTRPTPTSPGEPERAEPDAAADRRPTEGDEEEERRGSPTRRAEPGRRPGSTELEPALAGARSAHPAVRRPGRRRRRRPRPRADRAGRQRTVSATLDALGPPRHPGGRLAQRLPRHRTRSRPPTPTRRCCSSDRVFVGDPPGVATPRRAQPVVASVRGRRRRTRPRRPGHRRWRCGSGSSPRRPPGARARPTRPLLVVVDARGLASRATERLLRRPRRRGSTSTTVDRRHRAHGRTVVARRPASTRPEQACSSSTPADFQPRPTA